jgi:lipase chaperone LimK
MRTSLTLDEDTLRKGLSQGEKPSARIPRFTVKPKACGFRSEIDPLRLNQLNDELEMEDFQRKLAAGSAKR